MKKFILSLTFSCMALMVMAQFSDTTLTQFNWKAMDIGTKAWLFTLPADTVDADANDTVTFTFPLIFSTAFFAKITISSDTLVDTLPADTLQGNLIIESAPTSTGPWHTFKTISIDYDAEPITNSFYVWDFFIRVRYIAIDGVGRVRTWISMKPSSIVD